MLIVAFSRFAITTNMFANTNLDFAELIQWDDKVACNACEGLNKVKVSTTSNLSKKMMDSKIIQNRRSMTSHKKQSTYNVILTHNFYDNLDLILKYNSIPYMNQVRILLRSDSISSAQKQKITDFIRRIII
jgi:hypothetical protein